MRKSKYFINLTTEEVDALKIIIDDPMSSKTRRIKAEILLGMNGRRASYTIIDHLANKYDVSKSLVSRLISRYEKEGVNAVKKSPNSTPRRNYKMTDEVEKAVLRWIKTPPPAGKRKWSAYIIADKLVEEGIVKKISYQTIYRLLDNLGIRP